MNSERHLDIVPAIADFIELYGTDKTVLLPILREVQTAFRHVPREAMQQIAARLSLPLAHVEGVTGFYHFLSSRPRGRYDILLSDCVIDGFHGRKDVALELCKKLATPSGSTRSDGLVSIGDTSCTGLCDQGPAALINGHAVPNLDSRRIGQIVSLIEHDVPVEQWPAEILHIDSNIHQRGLLLENTLLPGSSLQGSVVRGKDELLARLENSGLRGRGGAGFNTALKWRLCRNAPGDHYIVCNADEGEPGTFKDRELLRHQAHAVFEGMTLGAWVVGAQQGFLYLRGEYLFLQRQLEQILGERRRAGLLGEQICGVVDLSFDITIRIGAGAYICGEESALLESLQGNRARPRNRPPYPVTHGFCGQPTVVNNVETFAAAAYIALHGSDWFAASGTDQSTGSRLLSISGDCTRPGIYEVASGSRIGDILATCGAEDMLGVQVGGPSGTYITPDEFDRQLSFEDLSTGGSLMIFNRKRDLLEIVHSFSRFFARESCGFCTPCRVGTILLTRMMGKIRCGSADADDLHALQRLGKLMGVSSHCGLGQAAPNSILATLEKDPQHYRRRLDQQGFSPDFEPEEELQTARHLR